MRDAATEVAKLFKYNGVPFERADLQFEGEAVIVSRGLLSGEDPVAKVRFGVEVEVDETMRAREDPNLVLANSALRLDSGASKVELAGMDHGREPADENLAVFESAERGGQTKGERIKPLGVASDVEERCLRGVQWKAATRARKDSPRSTQE